MAALGFVPIVAPLIAIRPLTPDLPDLSMFDGLVFTSPNGVAAFQALPGARAASGRVVFAVGQATAEAARTAGHDPVWSADGDAGNLAALIRDAGQGLRLLALRAEAPAADLGDLVGEAARVTPLTVYRAEAVPDALPADFEAVLIHSPRAARELAERLPPAAARGRSAVAISVAAARPLASLGFAAVAVAARPDEAALIDALKTTLGKPPADV